MALRDWMRDVYAPAVEDAPDTVGRERYARWSRYFNGTDLDLDEAYAYGWSEYHRLLGRDEERGREDPAGRRTPWEALAHLDEHGTHIEGVDEVREWLQGLMDRGHRGSGRHALRTRRAGTQGGVTNRPARRRRRAVLHGPVGGLLPPRPHLAADHGRDPFPGVRPGLHLVPRGRARPPPPAGAVGARRRTDLSRYQATVGMVSANAEGWALYAERLMDELGFLPTPSSGWATWTRR